MDNHAIDLDETILNEAPAALLFSLGLSSCRCFGDGVTDDPLPKATIVTELIGSGSSTEILSFTLASETILTTSTLISTGDYPSRGPKGGDIEWPKRWDISHNLKSQLYK